MMNLKTNKITQNITFFIILLIMAAIYNYWSILSHKPYSSHQWRQTDGLSIALNYYMEGMNFFEPKIHLQESIEGRAVGEFPILYYINALVWKITGQNFFTARLLTLLFSFTGLFCLFRLGMNLFKSVYLSLFAPIFLFISPIFVVYGNNFLANIPALCCVFVGWYLISQYVTSLRQKYLIFAGLAFALAGLLRVTMLSGLIPIGIIFILERINILKENYTRWKFSHLFLLIFPVLTTGSWVMWMKNYNIVNKSIYFLTKINPIWAPLGKEDTVWDYILFHRLPEFYQSYLLAIIFLATFVVLIKNKVINRYLLTFFFTIGFITLAYFILWYNQFDHHDYYYIDYYLYTVSLSFLFIYYLNKSVPMVINSVITKIMVLVFFAYSFTYCAIKTRIRYKYVNSFLTRCFLDSKELDSFSYRKWEYEDKMAHIEKLTPVLRNLGIKREDKVISLPDFSSNISLFFMDQKGFTNIYTGAGGNINEKIARFKKNGAKYLIVFDNNINIKGGFENHLKAKIFASKNDKVVIYELKTD